MFYTTLRTIPEREMLMSQPERDRPKELWSRCDDASSCSGCRWLTQRAWGVRAGWQWFRDRRAASCSRPG